MEHRQHSFSFLPASIAPTPNLFPMPIRRYKYNATIWDKDVQIMNQVFTFAPKGEFVSVKNVEGFPQKP